MGGVALLARLAGTFEQQRGDAGVKGSEFGRSAGYCLGIGQGCWTGQRFADTLAGDLELARNFAHALVLVVVGVSDGGVLIHDKHLHLCFHLSMRVFAQLVAEIGRVVNFSTITSWAGGQLLDYQKHTLSDIMDNTGFARSP